MRPGFSEPRAAILPRQGNPLRGRCFASALTGQNRRAFLGSAGTEKRPFQPNKETEHSVSLTEKTTIHKIDLLKKLKSRLTL